MSRPSDPTALAPEEATELRALLRRGKEQYRLTWGEIGEQADYDELQVRNWMYERHPLPRRVAKALILAVVDAPAAGEWRKRNGCSSHRGAAAFLCKICDPWIVEMEAWAQGWVWRSDIVSAMIDPDGIDTLSEKLARRICSAAGAGIARGKRGAVQKAIGSYLRRHGAEFAGYAASIGGFLKPVEQPNRPQGLKKLPQRTVWQLCQHWWPTAKLFVTPRLRDALELTEEDE